MAVRQFTGSDVIDTAVGAMGAATHGTYAAIVKRGSTGAWDTILAQHTITNSAVNQFAFNQIDDAIVLWEDPTTSVGPAWANTTDWGLFVVRKADGTVAPRFSVYNFTSETWTHANGSANLTNWAITTGGTLRFRWESFDDFTGLVAIRAGWANNLPWSADASGDAAIEAAGLELSAANWDAVSPSMGQLFNQAATTTAVEDWTGNGADQVAITGTAVVNGDDPPGFDFSLTPAQVSVEAQPGTAHPAGQPAALTMGHRLDAQPASATPAGQPASLTLGRRLDATPGTASPAAQTAALTLAHRLDAQLGIASAAGQTATLTLHDAEVAVNGLPAVAVPAGQTASFDGLVSIEQDPIILPPYREPAVPDFQEAAVSAYREQSIPAFREAR